MKCFYHSADLDGHCSGALIKMAYPDCEMIGISYGDEFPWDSLQPIENHTGETVFMVDFSLQPFDGMVKLSKKCNLFWIDHHKSAMEEARLHPFFDNIRGPHIFREGVGACALVWNYLLRDFKSWANERAIKVEVFPTFIKLLSEYDVWDHSDPRTLPFQYGMRQFQDTNPNNQDFWLSLFDVEEVQRITEVGGVILKYQYSDNEKYARACSFKTELDGLKCIAINKGLTNSQLFDSVWNPKEHDAMLSFIWRKGQWTVSLYSDKPDIDVSVIAKKRGGGGHKGAAGFQCKELPFKLIHDAVV